MRTLEENNAEDWDGLMCPECGHQSIEEYPGLSEEYSGHRKKMLNASRCTRESCPKGRLDPEEVSIQLNSSGIMGKFQGFSQSIIGKAVLGIVGVVALVVIASMLGMFGGADQPTPEGEFQEPVDGKIIINGTHPADSMEFTVQERDAPAAATFKFNGTTEETQATQEGTVGNTLNLDIQGNQPATDVSVQFTREDTDESTSVTLGQQDLSLSAQQGDVTDKKEVATVQENGTYEFETSFTTENKPDLVQTGYQINDGERTPVSDGTETAVLDLEAGDTVYLWMDAQNNEETTDDTTDDTSGDNNGEFDDRSPNTDIIDYSVSSTQIQSGETVTVSVTAENTGDRQEGVLVGLFVDGEQRLETQMAVPAGETITEEWVTLEPKTTTTISVNNLEKTTISVGEDNTGSETPTQSEPEPEKYGEGTINGTLTQTVEGEGSGPLRIDTTGDGTPDCTIEGSSGTCEFGEVKTGSQAFFVDGDTDGVTYETTYTKHTSPENIRIDLDGDGEIDIRHQSVLPEGESFEDELELSAGNYAPTIEQDTEISFNFHIEWEASERDS